MTMTIQPSDIEEDKPRLDGPRPQMGPRWRKQPMVTLLGFARHLGRRASRRKSSLLFLFFTSLLVLPVILYFLLAYFVAGDPRLLPLAFRDARSVLLVVAHPDDECLFFGPSILNAWGNPNVGRALLVLSSG
jgi:N-acetylglucosaminylphosphatidylinositol deacetylase